MRPLQPTTMIFEAPTHFKEAGYTLVEILFVIVIMGVLASLAAPVYFQHTNRAKASEAVATMVMVRQALRDHYINAGTYADAADITVAPITVNVGIAKYFSNATFSVDATSPAFTDVSVSPAAHDFVIFADGSASDTDCSDDDCAMSAGDVDDFRLEMDNTGRVFISFDAGTSWVQYL